MKCYYHPDRDAVAQCVECHKGLCIECARKWNPPHCDGCGVDIKEIATHKMMIIKGFGIAGILCGIIMVVFYMMASIPAGLGMTIMIPLFMYEYAGIPVGWWKLNKLTSKFFLLLPIIGWVIYFCIKFFLAGIVGIFALPSEYKRLKGIINN